MNSAGRTVGTQGSIGTPTIWVNAQNIGTFYRSVVVAHEFIHAESMPGNVVSAFLRNNPFVLVRNLLSNNFPQDEMDAFDYEQKYVALFNIHADYKTFFVDPNFVRQYRDEYHSDLKIQAISSVIWLLIFGAIFKRIRRVFAKDNEGRNGGRSQKVKTSDRGISNSEVMSGIASVGLIGLGAIALIFLPAISLMGIIISSAAILLGGVIGAAYLINLRPSPISDRLALFLAEAGLAPRAQAPVFVPPVDDFQPTEDEGIPAKISILGGFVRAAVFAMLLRSLPLWFKSVSRMMPQ
jgi:hypothetical protein